MCKQLGSRLTYGNVMATVAVFVALGGTSYAVATGSIDSREIKNNSVRSKDIRNNGILSRDVRDRSLLAKDFKSGQLPAGPTGKDGPPGKDGPQQPCNGLPSGSHCLMVIQCQPGERATGGGAGFVDFSGNEVLDVSYPLEADGTMPEAGDIPTGWVVAIEYSGGGPRDPVGHVVCASP
jgi:hypothetical protein